MISMTSWEFTVKTCRGDGERREGNHTALYFSGILICMAGVIYCGFARVAVQTHLQRYTSRNNQLLPAWKENVINDYNSDFRGYSRMLLPTNPKNTSKKNNEH